VPRGRTIAAIGGGLRVVDLQGQQSAGAAGLRGVSVARRLGPPSTTGGEGHPDLSMMPLLIFGLSFARKKRSS